MTPTQPVELTIVETKLETTIDQSGLEPSTAQGLLTAFRPLFTKAQEICTSAEKLSVTSEAQVDEIAQARTLRLALKAVRVDAEKKRKSLKEDSLRRGKAIDGVYNVLEYAVAPMEKRLLEMEEIAERAEAARRETIKAEREAALKHFGVDTAFYNLVDMPAAQFEQLLASSEMAHDAKIEAAKKAEADRIAAEKAAEEARITKEKAEAEERARIVAENARLKAEADAREAAMAEERRIAAAAAKAAADQAKRERDAIEAKARAERDEVERIAKAQRDAAEATAKAERQAREAMEAEEKKRRAAEQYKRDAEAAEIARAAAAPDKEKIIAFARMLRGIEMPDVTTPSAVVGMKSINGLILSLSCDAERLAAKL